MPVTATSALRATANLVNLSTPLGLLIALAGRARLSGGPDGLVLAEHYRPGVPKAGAFTVGNVIIVPGRRLDELEQQRPGTTAHEAVHAWQWCYCLGLPFLVGYGLASAWSWLRTGHPASANFFESSAGLTRGGYPELPRNNAGLRRIRSALRGAK
ncbi:hypothetical protein ATK74_2062 [Propionicimonas paludicola]|uniref:DUF4157 domain-containing protein n=1 Tax=Propionicimonas paludicola TaxID=185243 RepID=A0A2A9CTM0_9ACTN|nr:hypothetical protein [Propionicimonas paludicola]PFG17491.1 hypothetical protein ATK74_2062 [Propionicimonas paludicola]